MLDWNDGLQVARASARSEGAAFHVHDIWHEGGSQKPGTRRQARHGGMRPQKPRPDYPVVLAWSCFLLFLGAGAFAFGMAIHNEALAKQQMPRPDPIYYCATGVEIPAFEPCREMKGEKDI
jgi:hypothetical protein